MGKERKHKKKKKHHKKHSKGEKKSKKHKLKHVKKSKRDYSSSSSSSSSGSDSDNDLRSCRRQQHKPQEIAAAPLDIKTALELVGGLARRYPEEKEDFQFLFFKVDSKEAINIDGLDDAGVKRTLRTVFRHLSMVQNRQGDFESSPETPKLLDLFLPCFAPITSASSSSFSSSTTATSLSSSSLSSSSLSSSISDSTSPIPEAVAASSPSQAASTSPPAASSSNSKDTASEVKPTEDEKTSSFKRGVGPALPGREERERMLAVLKEEQEKEAALEQEMGHDFGPTRPELMSSVERQALAQLQHTRQEDAMRKKREAEEKKAKGHAERESWMTELPTLRGMRGGVESVKNRKFMSKSMVKIGNTSSWTETPAEKRKREEEARLARVLKGGDEDALDEEAVAQRAQVDRLAGPNATPQAARDFDALKRKEIERRMNGESALETTQKKRKKEPTEAELFAEFLAMKKKAKAEKKKKKEARLAQKASQKAEKGGTSSATQQMYTFNRDELFSMNRMKSKRETDKVISNAKLLNMRFDTGETL